MIGWLIGSRFGRWAGIALGALAAFLAIKQSGARDARKDGKIDDLENANDIRDRADDATSSEHLRKFDDANYRD